MIAQVFPSLRVLDRARARLAYLRLPGFGEPPGAGFESLAPGFETYDAFLAARYEAEGFLFNTTDAETAAEAVKRIRRDPSHGLEPVYLAKGVEDSGGSFPVPCRRERELVEVPGTSDMFG